MIVEIECLPMPPGSGRSPYAHVEAAIAVIQESGLKYEVSALGSTFEGDPDVVWPLVRQVHEAALAAGAKSVVSIVKLFEAREDETTMSSLTSKFRVVR
ncbi:MAG: thiamine-binding protein [Dehalococcoidia bacterium]